MTAAPVGVGLVGCGNISGTYLRVLTRFPGLKVVACADVLEARARERAAAHPGLRPLGVEALLGDPGIEVVLNLTPPARHAALSLAALEAGKSVHTEKPLATTRQDGRRILDLAARKGLRVGAAPDTFLGAGIQTARALLDQGAIGTPVAASAFMTCRGHERWHPDPAFFYEHGAGPLFDMGPYYLTALVCLLGPVARVSASARISFPERLVASLPRKGERIAVKTPTHVSGTLEFECGALATLVMSFDVWAADLPRLEVYGSEGTLSLPDPNGFGGELRLRTGEEAAWRPMPLTFPHAEESRGLGLAEMAEAMREGRPHRADGALAFHVLDIMESLLASARDGRRLELESRCVRPRPMGYSSSA